MVTCYTGANWTKKFGEEVKKYKYAKKIYLESTNKDEQDIIINIQNILNKKYIKNSQEFDNILAKNTIFDYNESVEFSIRKICYHFENEKFVIENSVILFLIKNDIEFINFLNEFTNEAKIGNINLKFPEVKRKDAMREKSKEIIEDLLFGKNFTKKLDENELIEFFKEKTIVFCSEIKENEIRNLKDAGVKKYSLSIPTIKGALLVFVNSDSLEISEISKMMKDINFYIGGKSDTSNLYAVKKDSNCSVTKIKIILVV